ncbi:putative narbonolide/10-deoxymethynolide synthase [Trichinella pseudospiralis]
MCKLFCSVLAVRNRWSLLTCTICRSVQIAGYDTIIQPAHQQCVLAQLLLTSMVTSGLAIDHRSRRLLLARAEYKPHTSRFITSSPVCHFASQTAVEFRHRFHSHTHTHSLSLPSFQRFQAGNKMKLVSFVVIMLAAILLHGSSSRAGVAMRGAYPGKTIDSYQMDEPMPVGSRFNEDLWRLMVQNSAAWGKRDMQSDSSEVDRPSWKKSKLWGYGKAVWG